MDAAEHEAEMDTNRERMRCSFGKEAAWTFNVEPESSTLWAEDGCRVENIVTASTENADLQPQTESLISHHANQFISSFHLLPSSVYMIYHRSSMYLI